MLVKTIVTLLLGYCTLAGWAAAQTVGIGTTQGGATAQIANAIAKVVSAHSAVQLRPQAMANTQQYIPIVNQGRLELGLANVPQTRYAVSGSGMSEGKPNPNLRMVATLFPFRASLLVAGDAGIGTFAELKGKKVPAFRERALGDYIVRAGLAAGGLGYDDVEPVPTSNFPKMWQMFKAGQLDTAIVAVGSKPAYDLEATFGSVRFLSFTEDQQTIVGELLPGGFLAELSAAGGSPGEADGVRVIAYDYALFAHRDVADAIITEVVRALYDNPDALRATGPLWQHFAPENMAKDVGVEFHPAARAFYQQRGVWPR